MEKQASKEHLKPAGLLVLPAIARARNVTTFVCVFWKESGHCLEVFAYSTALCVHPAGNELGIAKFVCICHKS